MIMADEQASLVGPIIQYNSIKVRIMDYEEELALHTALFFHCQGSQAWAAAIQDSH